MLSCCKYIVLFYNFLLWVLGVVIFCLSAIFWWDSQNYLDVNDVGEQYVAPIIVLLVLGGVITIVGFLGCCGVVRESSCLLRAYFLICITTCVACGAALFWALQNKEVLQERIITDTGKLMKEKYGHGHTNATEILIDRIQKDFGCCGWEIGPIDWMISSYNDINFVDTGIVVGTLKGYKNIRIPQSCCKNSHKCQTNVNPQLLMPDIFPNREGQYYKDTCKPKLKKFIEEKWLLLIAIGGVFIGVQLFALLFACIMLCHLKSQKKVMDQLLSYRCLNL